VSRNTPTKTLGPVTADLVARLEERTSPTVKVDELADMIALDRASTRFRSLLRRLIRAGWLAPTSLRGVYEFVPVRAGPFPSRDRLLQLRALAADEPDLRFQLALGSAAFLRGYADTAPTQDYLLVDKTSTPRRGLRHDFRVIRTDPRRLFGADALNGVPVSTASRLLIDVALFWRDAGDLRMRDHWVARAARDADPKLVRRWAAKLGPPVVARVGYIAESMGVPIAGLEPPGRRTDTAFGTRGGAPFNARWRVYDAIGIGQSL
jgi:predicted transcriptional regulator of viral defense system